MNGGLSIPSITTSSWLSASRRPPPMPPGNMKFEHAHHPGLEAVSAGGCGARWEKRRSRQARVSRIRSPDGLSAPDRPKKRQSSAWPIVVRRRTAEPRAERLPPHPDRVDLVDEDDALAAPLPRQPLGLPGDVADDDRVNADERRGKARARDRDERGVEPGRDRLREHRLAGAGSTEEENASLALAACLLEVLAGLPDRDDAANLFLRLSLPADILEPDAPLGVTRLECLDL